MNFIASSITFDSSFGKRIASDQKFETITMITVLNLPSSVGHLELCSSNPFVQPKIFPNFYEKPDDLYRMMSSLKLLREIFKQPPLSTVWNAKEIGLNDEYGKWCSIDDEMSDEDWERYIRGTVIFIQIHVPHMHDKENFSRTRSLPFYPFTHLYSSR